MVTLSMICRNRVNCFHGPECKIPPDDLLVDEKRRDGMLARGEVDDWGLLQPCPLLRI
jgi:hypothetical protein